MTFNRLNIKTQLIKLFSEPNILSHDLNISIIAPNGKKELGVGIGVTREAFCLFFEELFVSSAGKEKKIPTIRHDMGREEWNAIGKMLVYLIKRDVHYFPLNFSQAFISSCLFSEEQITSHDLLSSFKNFVALNEKDVMGKRLERKISMTSKIPSFQC